MPVEDKARSFWLRAMLGFLAGSDTLFPMQNTFCVSSCTTLALSSCSLASPGAKVTEHIPWIADPLHQLGLHSHMLLGLVAQCGKSGCERREWT